jgi:hypothetical protein
VSLAAQKALAFWGAPTYFTDTMFPSPIVYARGFGRFHAQIRRRLWTDFQTSY